MDRQLAEALVRWREADLLSPAELDAIRDFEDGRAGRDAVAADAGGRPSPGRRGLLAEGLAYVGAALAFGAGVALFGELWEDLGAGARIALSAAGTAILGGAATVLRDRTEASLRRLATVLAALAVVGVGLTIGLALSETAAVSEEWVVVLAGLGAVVVGTPVHLARQGWPTTLALGGAVLTTVLGLESFLDLLDGPVAPGVTLLGLGLAWACAGWAGATRPRSAFEVTGLVTAGFGTQLLAFADGLTVAALVIGLLVAAGAMAVGLGEDRTPPAVLGGLGVTVFAPQLVFEVFGETVGGPLALFVGGISLVTVAVTLLRREDVL